MAKGGTIGEAVLKTTTKPESPDNGAGEQAVAWQFYSDNAAKWIECNEADIPDLNKAGCKTRPLYTRAQDAAGKGVEVYTDIDLLHDIYKWFVSECAADPDSGEVVDPDARPIFHRICLALAAKPAQVGQKYRQITIEEAKHIERTVRFLRGDKVDHWAMLLHQLKAIGAVVPAQDGAK